MSEIIKYLPFIIPLAIIQGGLMIAALIHILTHKHYRIGNRIIWVIISLCISMIGPVLYFCIGRGEDGEDE